MKHPDDVKTADAIGADSWALQYFNNLPKDASAREQIGALRQDEKWMQDHIDHIASRIGRLQRVIATRASANGEEVYE